MGTSHPNRRLGRTAAGILVAVGAVGTTTAAVVAYADNQPAATTGTITDNSGSNNTGNTDQSSGTSGSVPQLSPGQGTAHARSSGS
ncbi:hypothetical protein J2W56_003936 [Nocardia kruczakiae]|uniref:CAP domain-containing protein n=1 Tax=Nocardia kruczakiae TaxID=261477 RepID=A0ABU1XI03_9NOCA|nr:hypothetical protein [Nocardia kruczakiae]MDR7170185.1 hypothetical protein [Nocardia kruczakiae]